MPSQDILTQINHNGQHQNTHKIVVHESIHSHSPIQREIRIIKNIIKLCSRFISRFLFLFYFSTLLQKITQLERTLNFFLHSLLFRFYFSCARLVRHLSYSQSDYSTRIIFLKIIIIKSANLWLSSRSTSNQSERFCRLKIYLYYQKYYKHTNIYFRIKSYKNCM